MKAFNIVRNKCSVLINNKYYVFPQTFVFIANAQFIL